MRVVAILLGPLLLVLAGACAGGEQEGSGSPPGLLAEGQYRSSSASTFELVEGTVVSLTRAGSDLSVSAGCNTLGAAFELEGDEIVVGGVQSTMMGCAEDLADQDARLSTFLESRPVVSASPDGFTLTVADGATLVFVSRAIADPDRAIEGTRWVLNAVVDGDTAVGAAGFDTVELFLDGGVVSVTTGCSAGQASYSVDGDDLLLGPLELTPAPAGDCSAGVAEAEAALVAVFGGTAVATAQADTLELRGDGIGLNFREG